MRLAIIGLICALAAVDANAQTPRVSVQQHELCFSSYNLLIIAAPEAPEQWAIELQRRGAIAGAAYMKEGHMTFDQWWNEAMRVGVPRIEAQRAGKLTTAQLLAEAQACDRIYGKPETVLPVMGQANTQTNRAQ